MISKAEQAKAFEAVYAGLNEQQKIALQRKCVSLNHRKQ